jgi:hypothetical protein
VGGALLLGVVPDGVVIPVLVLILLVSAVRVWRHDERAAVLPGTPICPSRGVARRA